MIKYTKKQLNKSQMEIKNNPFKATQDFVSYGELWENKENLKEFRKILIQEKACFLIKFSNTTKN